MNTAPWPGVITAPAEMIGISVLIMPAVLAPGLNHALIVTPHVDPIDVSTLSAVSAELGAPENCATLSVTRTSKHRVSVLALAALNGIVDAMIEAPRRF